MYLPQNWYPTFECKADEDFDLHDYIKALCVGYGIPTQIIRENKSLQYPCQCSVMWHLGIATYSKITGVPWKLAQMSPDTAYIGMSYALRNNREKSKFVTCCSQVFDAEGSGMEFVAYETSDFSYVAEKERSNIKTRQAEGIKSALANGVKFGRPKSEIPKDFIRAYELYKQGFIKVKDVMSMCDIAKSTFYKYEKSIKC